MLHYAPQASIAISREDPSSIPSDAVLNITTPEMKPVGPSSKSVQLAGGLSYKKLVAQSLNKDGRLQMGKTRKLKGTSTSSIWVYNITLPKFKMNKKETPTLVYKYLMRALETFRQDGLDRIVIPPNDLMS